MDVDKGDGVRDVLGVDLSVKAVAFPSSGANGSDGDQMNSSSDVNRTTGKDIERINGTERDPGKTNRIPLPVTTTSDEQKKFTERLKKYRRSIIKHKTTRQQYPVTRIRGAGGGLHYQQQEGKDVPRNVNEKLEKGQEQLIEVGKDLHRQEKQLPVLKRSLPSSFGIEQMESDEQERQIRRKLSTTLRDLQYSLKSYPAKRNLEEPQLKRTGLTVSKNSALYDFLTVSVCGSPTLPNQFDGCVLQRSISAPPSFEGRKVNSITSSLEDDKEGAIGDFVASAEFWNDILLMESEIPILNQYDNNLT